MSYTVTVNGVSRTVEAPADMPLLWVLRDVLDLKGTKFGCGAGICGACTVHVSGKPMRSCQIPIAKAAGASITTIEGLAASSPHPVQQAWAEIDVAQCGYCQAGQIMTAVALLASNPKPSADDVDMAMNGNICRCGTYLRIREAVQRAAAIAAGTRATTAAGKEAR